MTVIIGIDPHKRSHTAVALDEREVLTSCVSRPPTGRSASC